MKSKKAKSLNKKKRRDKNILTQYKHCTKYTKDTESNS